MRSISKTLPEWPQLDHLRSFALVIERGSFSAAAEQLGLSQPAVSLQLRQLERRLGVRLVERVGRRAAPTEAGAELLRHLPAIESSLEEALRAVARHAAGIAGRVRLGTGATACLHFLPPVLRALRRRHPELRIVVGTGNTDDYVRQVEDNTVDLALVTLPAGGRALEVLTVLEDEYVAIARKDAPGLPRHATPAALQPLELVLFEPAAHTRRLIDRWFAAAGLNARPVMELGSVEAIKEMVAAGLGHGIVPAMAVRGRAAHPGLQVMPLRPRLSRTLALVMRRDKPLTKGLKAVVDAIVAAGRKP